MNARNSTPLSQSALAESTGRATHPDVFLAPKSMTTLLTVFGNLTDKGNMLPRLISSLAMDPGRGA